jgi:hypothetical protein
MFGQQEATRDLLVAAEDEEASEALLHHHPHVSAGDQLAQAQGSLMQVSGAWGDV